METTAIKTTFPKYAAYKDSGAPWIGKIPIHWQTEKGKWLFIKNERPILNEDEIVTCFRDGEVTLRRNRRTDGFTNAVKEHGYQGIRKGDLVIHGMDAFAGSIGVSDSDGKSTPVYLACTERFPKTVNQYFFAYFLRNLALNGVILSLAKGIRERSTDFRFGDFGELILAYPPLPEQTAIAAFLDDKTAKIDRVIAQKEQLIVLLKERKQIIIQNAVTKGLDPTVKMKDSEVEWITEVPEHWNMKRLKYVLKILKRIIGYEGPDVLSITQKGIKVKDITSGEGQLAMNYAKYQTISKGEFAMNHMDLLTGYVDISKFDGVISPDYRVFKPFLKSITDEYLLKLFQVGYKGRIFYRYGQGVSQLGRWRFPADNFHNFSIPIPPIEEQKVIVQHIKTQSSKIELSIGLQQKQITKLKEYKATLIDSAVTGKIKVG